MTSVRPIIDQHANLELTEEPETLRWEEFSTRLQGTKHIGDTINAYLNDQTVWATLFNLMPPGPGQQMISEMQVRLQGSVSKLLSGLSTLDASAKQCQLKQHELRYNTTKFLYLAIESYLAYRPPEAALATMPGVPRADLFTAPKTRVDLFNQSLGHPQPPGTGSHLNDGLADPNKEDADNVLRARPLLRPDLVTDPTNAIPVSNM